MNKRIENLKNKIELLNSIIEEQKEFKKDSEYKTNAYYNTYFNKKIRYNYTDSSNLEQYKYYKKESKKIENKIKKLEDKKDELQQKLVDLLNNKK